MTVINRAWDTVKSGFVTWKTGVPDTEGFEYPGPGDFTTQTADRCVVVGARDKPPVEAQLHNLLHNPVGLWQLNGDRLDSTSTGADLSVAVGIEQYGPGVSPGTKAAFFNRSTRFQTVAPAPAPLLILGDLTVELLCFPIGLANDTFGDSICHFAGIDNSGLETENFLWLLRLSNSLNNPEFFWENGAGGVNNLVDTDFVVEPGRWHHFALVRISGGAGATTGQIYMNGVKIAEGTTFNEPTGAVNSYMKIGATTTGQSDYLGYVQSVKVIAKALTADQILAEARLTLPPGLRP